MLVLKRDFPLLKYVRIKLRWAFSGEPPRSFIGSRGKLGKQQCKMKSLGWGWGRKERMRDILKYTYMWGCNPLVGCRSQSSLMEADLWQNS